MNAEEKKLLKENAIVHQLSQTLEGIKRGPSLSTYLVLGGIGILVLAGGLFTYLYRSSEAAASHRWVQIDDIVFEKQIADLANDEAFSQSPQGRLVRFKDARFKLAKGLREFAASPSTARTDVEEGTKIYEDLARAAGRIPLLHQEAMWGTAKGHETLGDLDKAVSYYRELIRKYGDSALGKDAAKQLERLETAAGRREAEKLSNLLAGSGK